jgi:hypothetical protein
MLVPECKMAASTNKLSNIASVERRSKNANIVAIMFNLLFFVSELSPRGNFQPQ